MESSSCWGRGWFGGSGARGAVSLVSVRAQRRMHRVSHGERFWSATRRPVRAARVCDVGCGLRAPRRGSRPEGSADRLRPQAFARRGGRRAAEVACLVRSMGRAARVEGGRQAVESRRSRRGPWFDAGRADGRDLGPGAPGLGQRELSRRRQSRIWTQRKPRFRERFRPCRTRIPTDSRAAS